MYLKMTRKNWLWVVGGALLLAGLLAFYRLGVLPAARIISSAETGQRGPLVLELGAPVDIETVQHYLKISPDIPGRWAVEGKYISFWPAELFPAGQNLELTARAGLKTVDGRRLLRDTVFSIPVRYPAVAYLGGVSTGTELWLANTDGSGNFQLTDTGGRVLGFAASLDGSQLAYVVKNDLKGSDIYLIQRDGSEARILLTCGADRCQDPAWHSDGSRIIFVRVGSDGVSHLRILTLAGREEDAGYQGFLPSWSSDGKTLAFYDSSQASIRLVDAASGLNWLLAGADENHGAWSAGGTHFIYLGLAGSQATPYSVVYEIEVATQLVRPLFVDQIQWTEYSLPQPSPSGSEFLVAQRPTGTFITKQLVICTPRGEILQAVTDDVLFAHGSYSWSPDGANILYQRWEIGSSDHLPEVLVWRRSDGQRILLARDAALPAWVP